MQLKRTAQMLRIVQKRQLGRKMQILHKLATCFLCKITDAPHTGARLETQGVCTPWPWPPDAPHTGARLETKIVKDGTTLAMMPPTRGHDLKPHGSGICCRFCRDAPHTGARLETSAPGLRAVYQRMPPTRGHDLKHFTNCSYRRYTGDAPHTGARLETSQEKRPGAI